jgi:molybdenum cofactor biosynthesis protein B
MQSVQSVSVHIAVLAVGKDAAPTHAVSEAATKAGHQVVARATVSDTEAAVRAQMQRWIEDANVDVVIVSGGVESESAGAALKPLITQMLPGFTDLFRYLAFQEIGASAMLSNAEAAQCSSTFVFVLPAAVGAVKAAMEKLILPQLDSNTMPKNLVTQMPRVRALENGVPMPIAKEKTSSGSGLSARAPSSPVRKAAVTGANVIRKIDPDEDAIFDPQTKPIDVAKLEEQIALSESQNAETKQVDLARLPKVPPGADPLSDDTDQIMPGDLPTKRQARLESAPIEPPAPARRKVQRTEPSAVVPPPRPITKGGLIPEPPAPRAPISLP